MTIKSILVAAALLSSTPALAHGPATGPNGGTMTDAGDYHLEAVASGTGLTVYVLDGSNQPVVADGFKGTAIFVVDGKPQRIVLTSAGGNKLSGTSAAPLASPKGAVQLSTPDGKSVQGKFE